MKNIIITFRGPPETKKQASIPDDMTKEALVLNARTKFLELGEIIAIDGWTAPLANNGGTQNGQQNDNNTWAAEIARLEALIPNDAKTKTKAGVVPVTAINPESKLTPKATFKHAFASWAYDINRGSDSIENFLANGWSEDDLALLVKYCGVKDNRNQTNNNSGDNTHSWKPGTLGVGVSGPEVKALQSNLIAGKFLAPTINDKPADDGIFGQATKEAVMALQKKLGGGLAVDGAYGSRTKAAVAANPDIFKSASVTPNGGVVTPNNGGVVTPSSGAPVTQASKIARFKELINKASSGTLQENQDPSVYFLRKIKLLEGILNEGLTPAEAQELEALAKDLGQEGAEKNPELVKLINVYNGLKANGTIAANTVKAQPAQSVDNTTTAATTQGSSEEDQRAQYQKFYDEQKAKEAKEAAATVFNSRIQSRYAVKSGMTIIGKEDGVIYWADATTRGEMNDQQSGRAVSMAMYKQGTNFVDQQLKDAINTLGMKIVPYVKPAGLGTLDSWQAAPDGSASIQGFKGYNGATKLESVGFQPDEVNRIVSLVHYR